MDYTGQNTGVYSHSLHQGIFQTQGSNLGCLHCRQILYHLNHLSEALPNLFPFREEAVADQLLSLIQLFATPWTAAHQASLSLTISLSLLTLVSIESVMPSNHLIPCCLFSSHLQSFPASGSFQMSQFFASGGQMIGASALASVLLKNIQD